MPLKNPPQEGASILYVGFNQDYTCLSIADFTGIKIYSLDTHKICYQADLGAVSIVEMLFCTSLLVYVGAGEQPKLTPRKLTLLNTTQQNVIQDLSFPSSVLSVRINRKRLVAVLERVAHVYALETLELLQTISTSSNPQDSGELRIYDLLRDGSGTVQDQFQAHKTPVAVMAWNHDGTLLASASHKGTILRVHRIPGATRAYSFRRGTYNAEIHAIAFSPAGVQPPLLSASSGHGTIHLFRLNTPSDRGGVAAAASGFLANVMPGAMEPQRCFATVRLPCHGVPALCALQAVSNGGSASRMMDAGEASWQQDSISLVVATADGILYEYRVQGLTSPGPTVALEGEFLLLGHKAGKLG